MEKQLKLKNKILKAVAAVSVTFQNPPFSPGRDHKSRQDNPAARWARPHGVNKGFSGPIVSMIPDEARKKPNENYYQQQDPTSPKISCMGQIKYKKKQIKKSNAKSNVTTSKELEVKKRASTFQRMLFYTAKPKSAGAGRRKSDASAAHVDDKDALANRAPHVTQMKRFASGRETFANFDWKARVEPEEIDLDYSSDEDRVVSEEEEDDEEFRIPFSAPILVDGGDASLLNLKPRKEINLWKRRTMAPPRPLQLGSSG